MKSLKISLLALSLCALVSTKAQYNWDFGGKLGAANYLGEIGGKEDIRRNFIMDMKLRATRPVISAYARYKLNGYFAFSGSITLGQITGDDQFSENIGRNTRNLRFKNNLFEVSTRTELYIYEMNDVGGSGRYWVDMKIYGFTGLSVFRSNPKGRIDGQSEWYELQPLQTEGVQYSKWGLGIPAGAGVFFTYKRKHRMGFEMNWTTTFTDYLDDISTVYADPSGMSSLGAQLANQSALTDADPVLLQSFQAGQKRGDPTHNDSYLFATLSYGYVLRGKSNFYKQNYGWSSGKKYQARKVRAKF
jgi:hypothetical protein